MNRLAFVIFLVIAMSGVLFAQINWIEHVVDSDFNKAYSVYAADIDGDNDIDVLGAAYDDDAITWWENMDGYGTTWTEHIFDSIFDGAYSVYAAYVNNDSYLDIIGAASIADDITWWENTDGTGTDWTEHVIDANFNGARCVYAIDLDDDDDVDVLGAAADADDITWWENVDGTGTNWTEHIINASFDGAASVYAADVDGDNDLDVLGAAKEADFFNWWENVDGEGESWIEHNVDSGLNYPLSVYGIDIDSDDDTDVLGAAFYAGTIRWWENSDGLGTSWTEHIIGTGFSGANSVFAIDLDDDDDIDVLGTCQNDDEITWWENADDTGTIWIKHIIDSTYNCPHAVYAIDMDNDDDIDVLGAAYMDDEITWWENIAAYLDVSTISIDIDSPLPEGTVLSPQATVKNEGNTIETFNVTCEINPGAYSSTENVSDLAPGDSIQVMFSPDFTFETGDYTVKVYTQLAGDENPVNDTLEKVIETYDPGIEEGNYEAPTSFSFDLKNNPANGKIIFNLTLPEPACISLQIYDVSGRLVEKLTTIKSAGHYEIPWTPKTTAGVYFYSFTSPWKNEAGKIVVLQ
jgi:hypothetical protein